MIAPVKKIEALVNDAVLGKQIDDFMRSDVGKYVLELAAQEQAAGYEKLKTVDCTDSKAIMAAQNEVWRAEIIADWLSRAVVNGLRATEILEGREDDIG